jgi:hypothetical protein
MGGWMGGCKSRFKDCLQQSKKISVKAEIQQDLSILKYLTLFTNQTNGF